MKKIDFRIQRDSVGPNLLYIYKHSSTVGTSMASHTQSLIPNVLSSQKQVRIVLPNVAFRRHHIFHR